MSYSNQVGTQAEYFEKILSESNIRVLQLAQIFPRIENKSVKIGAIDPDTSHPNHVDMLYVCAIARHIGARRIFEFGTYLGRTTFHLALGKDVSEVYTLDLNPEVDHTSLKLGQAVKSVHKLGLQGHFFHGHECSRHIVQLHGDSRFFDYSPYRNNIDFIFIDGGHTYEYVTNDTSKALEMLGPGGVIVWHDFAPKSPDVVTFAQEFSSTRPLFWIKGTSLLVYIDGIDALSYEAVVPKYARSILKPV